MTYLVVSDVHANYPALEAVKSDAPDCEGMLFCGDAVGLMGFPQEVVKTLQQEAEHAVKGNHDISVLEYHAGHVNSEVLSDFEYESTHEALSESQKEWVSSKQSYDEVTVNGNSVLMAHAKPFLGMETGLEKRNGGLRKRDYVRVGSKLADNFDLVLVGHTHAPAVVDCSGFGHDVVIANPGSTGQPMGEADYALLETDPVEITLESCSYKEDLVTDRLAELEVPEEWWRY